MSVRVSNVAVLIITITTHVTTKKPNDRVNRHNRDEDFGGGYHVLSLQSKVLQKQRKSFHCQSDGFW